MLNCVIVDDEKAAIESLKWKLEECSVPNRVVACYTHAESSIVEINRNQPDVLFLDIEMPVLNGFQVLERIEPRDFAVVFVTAHDDYVLKALRASAVDYLTKPVDFDELNRAMEKIQVELRKNQYEELYKLVLEKLQTGPNTNKRIALPTSDAIQLVWEEDIVYCNASSNYTSVHLKGGGKIIVSKTLKVIEEMLSDRFLRIHNSYIVHLDAIVSYHRGAGGNVELVSGEIVPVSKNRKDEVLQKLQI